MKDKLNLTNIILSILCIILAAISIFYVADYVSNPLFHTSSIAVLDDKKLTVMTMVGTTVAISTGLSALPGDFLSPIAQEIAGLSRYLLIVLSVIVTEKYLLTITGYVSFTYLIPASLIIGAVALFFDKAFLKKLGIRLFLFGLSIFLVTPVSIRVTNLIEETYRTSIEASLQSAEELEEEVNETAEEQSWWEEKLSQFKDKAEEIGNMGKVYMSNMVDSISVLIVTSCVMPILVFMSFTWILKLIFGIEIHVPAPKKKQKKQSEEQ